MELMHQVSAQLKRLRLSGVVETLEARERQAIDGKWSYVDFLARLLEGDDPVTAGRYANVAAALSTCGYGAVAPIPRKADVLAVLRRG